MRISDCGIRNGSQEIRIPHEVHPPWRAFRNRSALTLLELLIVVVLLTTLVAAAIPILAPSSDERRIREAARGVNTFITGAQMKAVELRRPYGVALKRLSQDTNSAEDNSVCLELFYVEQPPAYRGFTDTSMARVAAYVPDQDNWYAPDNNKIRPLVLIQFVRRGEATPMSDDGLPVGWDADLFPGGVIRPGDVVELYGTRYELLSDTNDMQVKARFSDTTNTFFASNTGSVGSVNATQIVARPLNDSGQMMADVMEVRSGVYEKVAMGLYLEFDDRGRPLRDIPNLGVTPDDPFWPHPAPYKILRQPMPTSSEPYQLPEGTAIDLRASGIGNNDYFYWPGVHDNSQGVLIMFAPEGRVSRVSFSQLPFDSVPFNEPVTDNLFLLVGRRENCPAPDVANDPTLASAGLPAAGTPNRDQALQELKEPLNWLLGQCRWIAIGARSGRVVTTENAFVDPQTVIDKYDDPPNVTQSSKEMRAAQIIEAREFAREMTQMGGR